MKCNKCGADLQEGMNVCPNCNEPVVQTVENNTPVQEVQVPEPSVTQPAPVESPTVEPTPVVETPVVEQTPVAEVPVAQEPVADTQDAPVAEEQTATEQPTTEETKEEKKDDIVLENVDRTKKEVKEQTNENEIEISNTKFILIVLTIIAMIVGVIVMIVKNGWKPMEVYIEQKPVETPNNDKDDINSDITNDIMDGISKDEAVVMTNDLILDKYVFTLPNGFEYEKDGLMNYIKNDQNVVIAVNLHSNQIGTINNELTSLTDKLALDGYQNVNVINKSLLNITNYQITFEKDSIQYVYTIFDFNSKYTLTTIGKMNELNNAEAFYGLTLDLVSMAKETSRVNADFTLENINLNNLETAITRINAEI